MVIRFLVNEVGIGWMPDDVRLGGTEESVIEWARMLSDKYDVEVFSNFTAEDSFEFRGATYFPRREYIHRVGEEKGVTVSIMSYDIPVIEPTLYLTNETNAYRHDLSAYKYVIFPSQWAKDNIPVNQEVRIVPHGYHPGRIYPWKKNKKQCLYASSPDRGLEALEMIWPAVVASHPDAHLYVTYGGELDTPNTTNLGEVSEKKMDELYRTSEVWIHPCSGGELYGMSGIKAQAAGTIPVFFPTMALAETIQGGIRCTDPRDMFKRLVKLLGDEKTKEHYRTHLASLDFPTWEDSTNALESVILEAV